METPRESCEGDVRLFAQSATWPELTDAEIKAVANKALVMDSAGIRPGSSSYTDTFDHNRALALACALKAAKAAAAYDFSSGGQSHKRSQVATYWEKKAEGYRRRSASSGAISLPAAGAAAFTTTGDYSPLVNASDVHGEDL